MTDDILARLLAAKERAADPANRVDCTDMTSEEFLAWLRRLIAAGHAADDDFGKTCRI